MNILEDLLIRLVVNAIFVGICVLFLPVNFFFTLLLAFLISLVLYFMHKKHNETNQKLME